MGRRGRREVQEERERGEGEVRVERWVRVGLVGGKEEVEEVEFERFGFERERSGFEVGL